MTDVFYPIRDQVVVKRDAAEKQTPGGIVLPEAAKKSPRRGTVVAVGPGNEEKPQVKVGDKIVFAPYSGVEIDQNGEVFLIMPEKDILSVVKEKK